MEFTPSIHENIISNWDKLCRICLTDPSVSLPVYKLDELDEQYKMTFNDMLNTCSNLKVSSDDNFPQLICSLCITQMHHALEFKIKCQSSQDTLAQLFHKKNDLNIVIKCEVIEVKQADAENDKDYHHDMGNYGVTNLVDTVFVTDIDEKMIRKDQLNPILTQKNETTDSRKVKLVKMHTCPLCHVSCVYKELAAHKRIHPNTCWKCNIDFKSTEESIEHFKKHEENVCSECGKVFKNSRQCNVHKMTHAKDKCLCTICGKKLGSSSALSVHYRVHAGKKIYECNFCEKKFMDWKSRRYHIRNHHTFERPFACDFCSSRFADKSGLVSHLKLHSNERRFACTMCDLKFNRKDVLKRHSFKHSGEKRVFCTVCIKGFVTNHSLKVHMVTHTGEKNYVCSVCHRGFSQAHVLRTHMKTHNMDPTSSTEPHDGSL